MNLKLILPIKKINVNGKTINIPKLGIKHHELLKDPCSPDESVIKLLNSIDKNMNKAESEIVLLHVLEFNGKIKSEVEIDGHLYKLSDVYESQVLTHQFRGNTFYFREPKIFEKFVTPDDVLNKCFIRTDGSDIVPEFIDMPAFVLKWANSITTSISIKGPKGPIGGLANIIGLFE